MESQLICATQGWEDPLWLESYFPEECPEDWRFSFYSNDFRGLWVPATFWDSPDIAIDQFRDDGDKDFYFVFELCEDWPTDATRIIKTLSTIRPQVACLVLPVSESASAQDLETAVKPLAKHYAIAFSIPNTHPEQQEIIAVAAEMDCSIVWHAESGKPCDSGRFLPLVTSEQDLRQLRGIIETAGAWIAESSEQDAHRNAGLFYRPHKTAPSAAMKARELAELLDIA